MLILGRKAPHYMTIEKRYTFDTCVILRIYKEPNFADCLRCRIDFSESVIILNSQTVMELKRKGHDRSSVSAKISKLFGAHVEYYEISEHAHRDAKQMEKAYSTLHPGDSEILASTIDMDSTLISCDKGLVKAAKQARVQVINPDYITAMYEIPSNTHSSKRHGLNILRPGEKIMLSVFA